MVREVRQALFAATIMSVMAVAVACGGGAASPAATTAPAKPAATTAPAAPSAPMATKPAAPAATAAAPAAAAPATDYPRQPITLIVPWAAGGDTDVPMRIVAEFMGKELGQPVVVQNVTGGSGSVGARQARGARPDGYTLLSAHEHIIINQGTAVSDFGVNDFEHISLLVTSPGFLATEASKPWNNLTELVTDAKKRPNEITMGVTFGSTAQMFAFMIMHRAGIQLKPVGYDGTAQRMTALLGKQIDLAESPLSTAVEQLKAQRLKVLGYAWSQRDSRLPQVATFKEQGVDLEFGVSRGWFAPKGTPAPVIARLDAAMKKVSENPDFKKKIEDELGSLVTYLPSAQYTARLKQQEVDLRKVIDETGMKAQ